VWGKNWIGALLDEPIFDACPALCELISPV
jgi:hypothetical protein